ncbi:MAG: hypothetical protein EAZ60_11475 [Oscillatoriales cyanobacterium]|nr:MAG: hypothetical protein EAZ83_27315 [Oscillatoriales cyanobacterium]TAE94496.1 MAG: hypothetical protein EAZ79_22895 [Oscillatoriales cyanobacterium]TAF14970.1 MAG: hypothetical protein EAZ73_27925 [Oscillatoriales cyanobacterium]TAF36386.1 MAG: hypothetical protein EAZ69_10780 [Oscillatoriales cyanobacterium]TAF55877.1 MAG: hypothetical protein EAZ60_11475 [Oscillatoriales cyanobacterium]
MFVIILSVQCRKYTVRSSRFAIDRDFDLNLLSLYKEYIVNYVTVAHLCGEMTAEFANFEFSFFAGKSYQDDTANHDKIEKGE